MNTLSLMNLFDAIFFTILAQIQTRMHANVCVIVDIDEPTGFDVYIVH